MKLTVYTASKFSRASMWKTLIYDKWRQGSDPIYVDLGARWVNDYADLVPDHPQYCKLGWKHDIEDVMAADILLVYAAEGEHLRGALVEVGAAIAAEKPVIAIGDHPDYGTWKFHELVYCVEDFNAAKTLLRLFALEK